MDTTEPIKTNLTCTMARHRLKELFDRCPVVLVQYARTDMSGGLNKWRWYRNVYVLDFVYQGDGDLLRRGTYVPMVRCVNNEVYLQYDCLSLVDGVLEFQSHSISTAPDIADTLSWCVYYERDRLKWMVIP